MASDRLSVIIDGRTLSATPGQTIIQVADAAGVYIPRFCYHEKLSVVANCRMCLVEVEKSPKPLPACATPVSDGMRVYTRSPLARRAQQGVMRFLLINHPLDCPVCDQGGECELQDLALCYGAGTGDYLEAKRAVADEDLGPLVSTDMTRCIHCTRCIRVLDEIAGVHELGATGRGDRLRIGTFAGRALESELSGNVIDVCPVGALNNKPFRMRARAWEMVARPAVSAHDATGAHLYLHSLRGEILRAVPRRNEAVNEVWLADRDRYACHGLAHAERVTEPLIRDGERWRPLDWETALDEAARALAAAHGEAVVLGSPAAPLEEAAPAFRPGAGPRCRGPGSPPGAGRFQRRRLGAAAGFGLHARRARKGGFRLAGRRPPAPGGTPDRPALAARGPRRGLGRRLARLR
ncbi:MAG: hypothetical protein KatS3mg121_1081 [Gammaproteobacteria bacterium]|nr:MAG: hypothetical protein KatS3mg121_1081 [Gammaproteobacteria bacterium]